MKQKVLAYIIQDDRLLVFRHTQFPEAGIQVPGGTVEQGEALDQAVLREAAEETGLESLRLVTCLGSQDYDLAEFGLDSGWMRRHFYHLALGGEAPETWLSYEWQPSDGSPAPIEFEFFWVRLPDEVPELAGDQGAMLKSLSNFPV